MSDSTTRAIALADTSGRGRRGRNIDPVARGTFPFLVPALIVTALLVLFPVLYTVWLSLTQQDIAGNNQGFVGFENFAAMFQNPEFWNSLRVTIFLFVLCLFVETVLGLALGYLLSRDVPGRAIFQGMLLIPAITASVAVALVWLLIFDPALGAANQILEAIGLDPVVWLGSREMAPWSIAIVDIWQWTPFMALIISAGIRSLPTDPFEAAAIDGAGPIKQALYVGLPLLRSVLLVAMLLRTVDLVRFFDTVYIMTQGGPVNATNTLNVYGYRAAFIDQDPSYAAALQLSLLVLVILIAAIFTIVRKRVPNAE
ncbi:sugar ABC transporter permease [Leucobacter sp. CSA1]|uniref:Sugar ABC transporter permease n=1 Tax=Leucobacter chromiisoli TaxID=2796471 RepID=A0A934QA40_9MICO|nr:sugar ABC transporter permease [Leucobacter chromiisoli]MBK0419409.1 sugar ABC transporter permease [Leucobacter chromiisoli]